MQVKFGLVGTCAVLAVLVALVSASADVAREDASSVRIAFIEGELGVIYTVRPDGSGKRRVTPPRRPHDFIDESFDWSPDGRKIVYSWWGDDIVDLFVIRAAGGKPRRLTKSPADEINPAWSRDGKKIAYDLYNDGYWNVNIMNADGSHNHRATPGIHFHGPAWSADGRKIAFSDRNADPWTMNVPGRVPRRVADVPGAPALLRFNVIVAWAPQGRRLAVIGNWDIWIVNNGVGKPEQIFHADENSGRTQELAWSPDARKLAFAHVDRGDLDIYTINADGTDLRQLTPDDRINSNSPSWSPDGRQLAFSDGDEVYVMNADGSNQRNVSQNAKKKDYAPRWAPAA